MATVTVEYYGMSGSGRNVTEAKRDAGRRIEAALSGHYTPEILSHRGIAILVYREPQGWCNRIIADPERGIIAGRIHGSNHGTREECVRAALNHLAQLGWTHDDDDEAPDFVKDRADRADFRSWVTFQRRHKRARESGLNSNDAHAYACGAHWRPELTALVEEPSVSATV